MKRRIFINNLSEVLSIISAMLGIVFLIWIIKDVVVFGIRSINLEFFLENPKPPGIEGGGLKNAIFGSIIITTIAVIIAFPIGLLGATYINEYRTKISGIIRFITDIMLSAPSIVIGAYVYALLVKPFKTFSAISGSIALAIIMVPIVLKAVDELLNLVPSITKEAAYALGAPKWMVITQIIWRYIRAGIITAFLIAFARIMGETAPLLFTSFNNMFFETDITKPMATLTVSIFNYAMSPYDEWHKLAWSASFLIVILVLSVNILSKIIQSKAP